MAPDDAAPVLVLCRDLMFGSKITGASKASGIAVKMLRDPARLAEEKTSRRLIVDLTQPGYIDAAAAWKRETGGHVTGFAGHSDTETIAMARSAGLDSIFSRGGFSAKLEAVLRGAVAEADPAIE